MTIYEKLAAIQMDLKAPKTQYNKFGKYNYRSCEDILEAVKPLCNKHKVLLTLSDQVDDINGRYYVKAYAQLIDMEDSGSNICIIAYAREPESKSGMDASQITGTASSYARKYALNGMFCIDDAKDADTDEYGRQAEKNAQKPKPAPAKETNPSPAPPPAIVKCKDCGKAITDTVWADGSKTSAKKLVNSTIQRYGVPLCGDCYTLRRAREQNDGNQGR